MTVSTTDMTLTSMPGRGRGEEVEVGVLEELPMRRRERASARVVVERDRGKTFEPKVPRGRTHRHPALRGANEANRQAVSGRRENY